MPSRVCCILSAALFLFPFIAEARLHQPFGLNAHWNPWFVVVLLVVLGGAIIVGRNNRELQRAQNEVQAELDRRLVSEEALKVSEKKYRMFAENAPDSLFSVNQAGFIDDVNEAFLQELSYSRDEIVGNRFGTAVHPDDQFLIEQVSETVFGGGISRFDGRVRDSQGVYRWYASSAWPIYGQGDEVVGFQVIARNVDQRIRDEIRLRQLSAAIEQAPVAVVITDCDAVIEYVNPACSQITGYFPEEILGQN
ncbi:MAG: PAS domain S-box protein, partial [Acidobacteriota bacterium]